MNRKEIGSWIAGSGVVTFAFDLLVHSGELLATIAMFFAINLDSVVAILGNLSTLAQGVEWLPRELLRQLFFGALVALIVYRIGAMIASWRQNA